ncbi:hypothetical protein BJX64DRAFT_174076 [Aspergillus heterothallicus]
MQFLIKAVVLALVSHCASAVRTLFHLPYPISNTPVTHTNTAPSLQHTVNCWGKAMHPELREVKKAIDVFHNAIINGNHNFPPALWAGAHTCVEAYCVGDTSIRYCNDGDKARTMLLQHIMDGTIAISNDCVADYNGKKVAGGVVDHPDHWSVVVQKDDKC